MADIGRMNSLTVLAQVDFGVYFDGENLGKILMPRQYTKRHYKAGESVNVFLFLDSEDRLVATTDHPLAQIGEIAYLKAIQVNPVGAFMDWGLPKDLLVPFREQKLKIREGKWYFVRPYLDNASQRIAATTKIEKFLGKEPVAIKQGEITKLLIHSKTEIGYSVIVNDTHYGMLYDSEVFQPLQIGELVSGYVTKVREDGKIDVSLHKPGFEKVDALSAKILDTLQKNGGFLAISDKSAPDLIYDTFGMSKKTFKKAIGALYKSRRIRIEDHGIRQLD